MYACKSSSASLADLLFRIKPCWITCLSLDIDTVAACFYYPSGTREYRIQNTEYRLRTTNYSIDYRVGYFISIDFYPDETMYLAFDALLIGGKAWRKGLEAAPLFFTENLNEPD